MALPRAQMAGAPLQEPTFIAYFLDGSKREIELWRVPGSKAGEVKLLPCLDDAQFEETLRCVAYDKRYRNCKLTPMKLTSAQLNIVTALGCRTSSIPTPVSYPLMDPLFGNPDEMVLTSTSYCHLGASGWTDGAVFHCALKRVNYFTMKHSVASNTVMVMVVNKSTMELLGQGVIPSKYPSTSGFSFFLRTGKLYGGPAHVEDQPFDGTPGVISLRERLSVKVDVQAKTISYKKGEWNDGQTPWAVGWTDVDTAEPLYFAILVYDQKGTATITYAKTNQEN
eukprot:m.29548 g.29548  ORF g.29548 m.29548 type:complete len:281 (+) comp9176_c0_seq1:161-1003(+)